MKTNRLAPLLAVLLSCCLGEGEKKPFDRNGDGLVVGLALSGGGLRATGLSYGAILELVDQGLMEQVDLISAVSGGSIVGAYYCLGLPLKEFGTRINKNLLTTSLGKVLDPRNLFDRADDSRVTGFAETLDDVMYGERRLVDLKERPYLLINAVNVETTSLFVFSRDGSACENLTGDGGMPYYRLADGTQRRLKVSEAVAASSCVPSVLNPFELMVEQQSLNEEGKKVIRQIRLMDGGLFDNLGLEPLLLRKCDVVIAVDASRQIITSEGYTFFAPGGTKVIPITRRRYRSLLCMYTQERLGSRFIRLEVTDEDVGKMTPMKVKLDKDDLHLLAAHGRELVKKNRKRIQAALGADK